MVMPWCGVMVKRALATRCCLLLLWFSLRVRSMSGSDFKRIWDVHNNKDRSGWVCQGSHTFGANQPLSRFLMGVLSHWDIMSRMNRIKQLHVLSIAYEADMGQIVSTIDWQSGWPCKPCQTYIC